MNVDYCLQGTPALSRKLLYINKLMRLNIDPELLRRADEGLLTHEQVRSQLPESLCPYPDDKALEIIQHSTDYDDRFVLGVRTFDQAATYSLMSAMMSGRKILISVSSSAEQIGLWKSFLLQHWLGYQHLRDDKPAVNHGQQILLVEHDAVTSTLLAKARDRVLVHVESASNYGGVGLSGGLDFDRFGELFTHIMGTATRMRDTFREFQKCIAAFHVPEFTLNGRPVTSWWLDSNVRDLISAMHPGLNVDKVLTTNQADQNNLLQMGFTLTAPRHMARLLGMHVGILDES